MGQQKMKQKNKKIPALEGIEELGIDDVTILQKDYQKKKHGNKSAQAEVKEPNNWDEIHSLTDVVKDILSANYSIVQNAGHEFVTCFKDRTDIPDDDKKELGLLILTMKDDIEVYRQKIQAIADRYSYRKGPVLEDELLDFYDITMGIENLTHDITTVLQFPAVEISILITTMANTGNTNGQ